MFFHWSSPLPIFLSLHYTLFRDEKLIYLITKTATED